MQDAAKKHCFFNTSANYKIAKLLALWYEIFIDKNVMFRT